MSLNNHTPIPTCAALSDCWGAPLWGCRDQAPPVLVRAPGARERVFLWGTPPGVDAGQSVSLIESTEWLPVFTTCSPHSLLPPAERGISCHFSPCQHLGPRGFFIFLPVSWEGNSISSSLSFAFPSFPVRLSNSSSLSAIWIPSSWSGCPDLSPS